MANIKKGVYKACVGTVKEVHKSAYGDPTKEVVLLLSNFSMVKVNVSALTSISYSIDNYACHVQEKSLFDKRTCRHINNSCFIVNMVEASITDRGFLDRVNWRGDLCYGYDDLDLLNPALYWDTYTYGELRSFLR